MTREEEAIKQLEDLREHCSAMINNTCIGGENIWRKDVEALNMAIKALEQEDILDKIRAEIQGLRNCSCSCSDGIIDDVEDIIDKYMEESEDKE